MPKKSELKCYFGCIVDGLIHRFPKWEYPHEERFNSWKAVLSSSTQDKGNEYIYNNVKLCYRHFEHYYQLPSHRLTGNAIPTLNLSTNQHLQQLHQREAQEVSEELPSTSQETTSSSQVASQSLTEPYIEKQPCHYARTDTGETTMGELAHLPNETNAIFQAVVSAIDEYFPPSWRTWRVINYSYKDIFGEEITQKTDAKLRFALPLDVLARAFDPSATSLSERRFRFIKNTILSWPLGRALLYAPHAIMKKIHPDYSNFVNAVLDIKPRLINRPMASCKLFASTEQPEQREASQPQELQYASPVSSPPTGSLKSLRSGSPIEVSPPKRAIYANNDVLLTEVLTKQTEMFSKLLNMTTEQNENVKKLLNRNDSNTRASEDVANESFNSIPDSTNTDDEVDVASCSSTTRSVASISEEQALKDHISEAQRKLAALIRSEIVETGDSLDFLPFTVEKEPKVLKADAELLKQGISCQRFGQEGWQNIRYSDTQKLFEATPAFSSLKTNNMLAGETPSYKSVTILEKVDMTLGAVTYGLLQQRRCFQDLLDKIPQDVRQQVGKEFLAVNSNFKKISDNLLQYVCGRRAEVIQQRRESYRPVNRVLRQILHEIPPSESHLFDDKALAEAVKEQGGIHKFFPIRRKQASYTDKPNYEETRKRDISKTIPSSFASKKKR